MEALREFEELKNIIPKDLLELVRHEPQPCCNRGRPANFLDASLKTKRRCKAWKN